MRRAFTQAILLALLAAVPALFSAWLHPRRPTFTEVVVDGEIPARIAVRDAAQFLWIDARPANDFSSGHVPGATRLTESEWDALLPPLMLAWPPGRPAIVYCASQQCRASRAVARRLRELGVAPVFELKGGWDAWLAAQKK
jgi:rhodanese-related sulfurtransferase